MDSIHDLHDYVGQLARHDALGGSTTYAAAAFSNKSGRARDFGSYLASAQHSMGLINSLPIQWQQLVPSQVIAQQAPPTLWLSVRVRGGAPKNNEPEQANKLVRYMEPVDFPRTLLPSPKRAPAPPNDDNNTRANVSVPDNNHPAPAASAAPPKPDTDEERQHSHHPKPTFDEHTDTTELKCYYPRCSFVAKKGKDPWLSIGRHIETAHLAKVSELARVAISGFQKVKKSFGKTFKLTANTKYMQM